MTDYDKVLFAEIQITVFVRREKYEAMNEQQCDTLSDELNDFDWGGIIKSKSHMPDDIIIEVED